MARLLSGGIGKRQPYNPVLLLNPLAALAGIPPVEKTATLARPWKSPHLFPFPLNSVLWASSYLKKKGPCFLANQFTTSKPILWRVCAYSFPIFPKPTTRNLFITGKITGESPSLHIGQCNKWCTIAVII